MTWEYLANATVGELVEEMIDQKLRIRDLKLQRDTLINWDGHIRNCESRIRDVRDEISRRGGEL